MEVSGPSSLMPYMLEMPDGSTVVGTTAMIEELKALPEDQRLQRLQKMEAERDSRGT